MSAQTGVEVGKDLSAKQLTEDFDSVILCCGATKPRDLPVEGRNLNGVPFAMELLTRNTQGLLEAKDVTSFDIAAKGKDVVVIGGGDTGTDCVGTSLRHGRNSIAQLEIMPGLPLERAAFSATHGLNGPRFTGWTTVKKRQKSYMAKILASTLQEQSGSLVIQTAILRVCSFMKWPGGRSRTVATYTC